MSAHLATLLPCLLPVLVATAQDEQAALSAGPASQLVIKGERHTGTNFLHEIVALNLGERACPGHRGSQCADPCRAHCASAALFKTTGDEQFKKEAAPEKVDVQDVGSRTREKYAPDLKYHVPQFGDKPSENEDDCM